MNQHSRNPRQAEGSDWTSLWRRRLVLEHETLQFILVSTLDLFMTYVLLCYDTAVESNPIAKFFFYGWGVKGLVYFKFGMVTFIVGVTQIVARKRYTTARRVLRFATCLVAAVVLYSLTLLVRHYPFG